MLAIPILGMAMFRATDDRPLLQDIQATALPLFEATALLVDPGSSLARILAAIPPVRWTMPVILSATSIVMAGAAGFCLDGARPPGTVSMSPMGANASRSLTVSRRSGISRTVS
jgi:hypothetical protein